MTQFGGNCFVRADAALETKSVEWSDFVKHWFNNQNIMEYNEILFAITP